MVPLAAASSFRFRLSTRLVEENLASSLTDVGDLQLLDEARRVAEEIVAVDPQLESHPELEEEVRLLLSADEGEYLFKS